MAHTVDGYTKVSARVSRGDGTIKLNILLSGIIAKVGGQTGGHENAAGALIPQEKDLEFVKYTKEYFEKLEQVVK